MLNALDPHSKEGVKQEVKIDFVEQCCSYKQRNSVSVQSPGYDIE
jgi:hypothetical protein